MGKQFLIALLLPFAYVVTAYAQLESSGVREIGEKKAGGLEVTLVSTPPRSQEEMEKMMEQMGQTEMQKMMKQKGMEGMKGMGGMMNMPSEPATHWLGVVILDSKTKKFVPNLKVNLTAKGPVTRKVDLMSMPGSYAQNISLPSGKYDIIVKIESPDKKRKPVEVRFKMGT